MRAKAGSHGRLSLHPSPYLKMKSIEKILFAVLILGAVVTGVWADSKFRINKTDAPVQGSVQFGSEYQATSTRNAAGTAMEATTLLNTGSGVLGSVVITGAAAGIYTFLDATTTSPGADWSNRTLASFPASTAAGTYTFDVSYQKGLLVTLSGTIGTGTITFR